MAKNQNEENSMCVCEKIYNAISFGHASRRDHRRRQCPQNSNAATASENRANHEAVVIPIEFVPPVRPTLHQNGRQMAKADPKTEPAPNSTASMKEDKVKTKVKKINEHSQVAKVSPNSSAKPDAADTARPEKAVVGTGQGQVVSKGTLKLEPESTVVDDNVKFSDYIDRAKMKIRTTTNVGDGKSTRRHDSFNDRVSNYISRAKVKIRGEGKNISSK